jgi:hypothetical protein
MHARVATFPPGTDVQPPEGAVRALTLVHRDDGRIVSIALFDGEPTAGQTGEVHAVATAQFRPDRPARYARIGTHHGFPMRDVSPAPLVGLDGLAGWMMLIDRRSGSGLGVLLFESEETLARGDEFVSGVDPGTAGPTSAVEFYEVASLT